MQLEISDPAPKDARPDDLLEPTSPSPWHANAHRLIVQPAKEKAANQIEGLLKDWLAGKLGEDALEESFRESLTDVRLSRQMQDAFVQSKVTMPASSSRRPSKRTADELRGLIHAGRHETDWLCLHGWVPIVRPGRSHRVLILQVAINRSIGCQWRSTVSEQSYA